EDPSDGGRTLRRHAEEGSVKVRRSGRHLARPSAHLAEACLLVVRDALEDLEGRVTLVSVLLQGGDVPLQVDRPLSEGKVLVPRLSLTTVIVVDVRETESVPQDREVLPRAVGPLVEVGVPDVQAVSH